jgi:YD repeat-containing protein
VNRATSNSLGSYTYDANGNTLTDAQGRSYTWDFENRLTQAVVPGTGTVTFKYDPFGRRIQKSGPLGTTNYLYSGPNVLEELDSGGNVSARYTVTRNVDEPLAELRSGTPKGQIIISNLIHRITRVPKRQTQYRRTASLMAAAATDPTMTT